MGYAWKMVSAVRQIVKVQADGRIVISAPEFRAGALTEVIVLLPTESAIPPADRMADCIIAAVALRLEVTLATEKRADFAPFAADGLKIFP